ncbi:predicted protein [Postia placenta Mad-698-R]|nr:predicted protein [Postia placenta Mad-698-R]
MPVRDNRVRGLRPPATRAPELASSFLTARVSVFQHTPSSEASEGSRTLPASRHSLKLGIHPHTLSAGSIGALDERFFGSAVLSASGSGALGERFGYGGSTVLSASNSAVRWFGSSTFDGGVQSGPRQGSAIVRVRSRWLRPHPGKRFGSDGGGNILRRSGGQQSVDSDGMRAGSGDAASGRLQAAPRALHGSKPPGRLTRLCWNNGANGAGARLSTGVAMPVRDNRVRGLRPPATRAPELASSFLTARVSVFQHPYYTLLSFLPGTMSVTLEATRYLSGMALTISLFDQLLNFSKEIELVWAHPRLWTSMQFIVVINRYGGGASMLFIAYGHLYQTSCHDLVVVALIYGVIGSAISYSPEINACVVNENAYHGRITGYMIVRLRRLPTYQDYGQARCSRGTFQVEWVKYVRASSVAREACEARQYDTMPRPDFSDELSLKVVFQNQSDGLFLFCRWQRTMNKLPYPRLNPLTFGPSGRALQGGLQRLRPRLRAEPWAGGSRVPPGKAQRALERAMVIDSIFSKLVTPPIDDRSTGLEWAAFEADPARPKNQASNEVEYLRTVMTRPYLLARARGGAHLRGLARDLCLKLTLSPPEDRFKVSEETECLGPKDRMPTVPVMAYSRGSSRRTRTGADEKQGVFGK